MKIEILATGGKTCQTLFCNVLEALRESGKKGSVVMVKDIRRVMNYGVLATPVLVINHIVMLSGRSASVDEIAVLLQRNIRL